MFRSVARRIVAGVVVALRRSADWLHDWSAPNQLERGVDDSQRTADPGESAVATDSPEAIHPAGPPAHWLEYIQAKSPHLARDSQRRHRESTGQPKPPTDASGRRPSLDDRTPAADRSTLTSVRPLALDADIPLQADRPLTVQRPTDDAFVARPVEKEAFAESEPAERDPQASHVSSEELSWPRQDRQPAMPRNDLGNDDDAQVSPRPADPFSSNPLRATSSLGRNVVRITASEPIAQQLPDQPSRAAALAPAGKMSRPHVHTEDSLVDRGGEPVLPAKTGFAARYRLPYEGLSGYFSFAVPPPVDSQPSPANEAHDGAGTARLGTTDGRPRSRAASATRRASTSDFEEEPQDRWPVLPVETDMDWYWEFASAQAEIARRNRLDREQEGQAWNEWLS